MGYRQRAVLTMGRASYLFIGDEEASLPRFSTEVAEEAGRRLGCALPVLLAEGWNVVSVTPLARRTAREDDYACTLVILTKEM